MNGFNLILSSPLVTFHYYLIGRMLLPESVEHRKIKELIENRLREWFGASIKESPFRP